MPLGSFGNAPSANPSPQELSDAFARLLKEVDYLLNGGLDTLNVNELSADVINAGVLNAMLVVVKAAYASGASITIDLNGIKINDGTRDTFVADVNGFVTMVGALIQSASGFPRIELNSTNSIFAAYSSASDAIKLVPVYSSGPPAILFDIAAATRATISLLTGLLSITTSGTTDISIQSAKDLSLTAVGVVKYDSWSKIYNTTNLQTLQQALDAISSSIPSGTYAVITYSGGVATSGRALTTADIPALPESKITNLTTDLAAKANKAQQAWQTPTLANSWVNYGAPYDTAQYKKNEFGEVRIKGLVKSGLVGNIFVLPVGCRPLERLIKTTLATTNGTDRVPSDLNVLPTGEVMTAVAYQWVSVDITFIAEQ